MRSINIRVNTGFPEVTPSRDTLVIIDEGEQIR
jgi:hypothetical protein